MTRKMDTEGAVCVSNVAGVGDAPKRRRRLPRAFDRRTLKKSKDDGALRCSRCTQTRSACLYRNERNRSAKNYPAFMREIIDEALQRLYWACRYHDDFPGQLPTETEGLVTTQAILEGLGLVGPKSAHDDTEMQENLDSLPSATLDGVSSRSYTAPPPSPPPPSYSLLATNVPIEARYTSDYLPARTEGCRIVPTAKQARIQKARMPSRLQSLPRRHSLVRRDTRMDSVACRFLESAVQPLPANMLSLCPKVSSVSTNDSAGPSSRQQDKRYSQQPTMLQLPLTLHAEASFPIGQYSDMKNRPVARQSSLSILRIWE